MTFRIIQATVAIICFVGWIIWQLVYKKKAFEEIKKDVFAILFFAAVWFGIYYWLIS